MFPCPSDYLKPERHRAPTVRERRAAIEDEQLRRSHAAVVAGRGEPVPLATRLLWQVQDELCGERFAQWYVATTGAQPDEWLCKHVVRQMSARFYSPMNVPDYRAAGVRGTIVRWLRERVAEIGGSMPEEMKKRIFYPPVR